MLSHQQSGKRKQSTMRVAAAEGEGRHLPAEMLMLWLEQASEPLAFANAEGLLLFANKAMEQCCKLNMQAGQVPLVQVKALFSQPEGQWPLLSEQLQARGQLSLPLEPPLASGGHTFTHLHLQWLPLGGEAWVALRLAQSGTAAYSPSAKFADENPNPVFRFQPNGTLLYSNRRNLALEQLICKSFEGDFAAKVARLMRTGQSKETEVLLGNRFYALSLTPVSAQGYLNIEAKDITERKLAEEKVRASVNLYRLLSENSHDLICLHQLDGRMQYVSQAAKEMLGHEPDELIGQPVYDFCHPDDLAALRNSHQQLLNGKMAHTCQYRLRSRIGHYIWVETITKPVMNAAGQVVQMQASSRNINERKQTEQELIQAKEAALQSMRAKDLFLSTVSHEIRTPMNAVIGMTHLLLQEAPRPDQVPHLQTLKFSAENLMVLINDILDFSKIDAGKIDFEATPFHVNELVHSIKNSFEFRAKEKGIQLKLTLDTDLPEYLVGDSVRLCQILTNLLGNAIKFTEEGKVTLEVMLEEANERAATVLFAVRDTGIGIPPDKIHYIFDRFTQANADTARKYGGTGLGLAIVKRLLELQGSRIEVESEPGKGSRFFFKLVLGMGAPPSPSLRPPAEQSGADVGLEGLRLLLVEDNETNQMVAGKFLNKWGVEVAYAASGEEALEKVAKEPFDIVLMDLQMPGGLDGYQTTQAIRKLQGAHFAKLPIVALTASAMADIKQRVLASGMDDYMSKPFNPYELYEKIARHTQRHTLQTPLGNTAQAAASPLFNYDNVVKIALGDKAFLQELTRIYIKAIAQLPHDFADIVQRGDYGKLREQMHRMNPTLRTLELIEVEKLLREALRALTSEQCQPEQMADLARQMQQMCLQIVERLEQLLDQ